jgi:tRNA(Ile)-lysidine synthase
MVPLKLIRVEVRAAKGESLEAVARQVRYEAMAKLVQPGMCLLTAHQQDDQAETFLLQLLRGSGPAGLAAMPQVASFSLGLHARPLLQFTRSDLADYAVQHNLRWLDDPSNRNRQIYRNFIRQDVLPVLCARWPSSVRIISRAAELQAEAAQLLVDIAWHDLITIGGSRRGTVSVTGLRQLSPARQRNVIRHWLRNHGLAAPARRQLDHILTDAVGAGWDRTPVITYQHGEVRRYRNELYAMTPLTGHNPRMVLPWDIRRPLSIPHLSMMLRPSMLDTLRIASGRPEITVRFRRGGERCRVRGQSHHRELKKLFQEAGVPPWERDRIPLIYSGESLVCVVGYWACV